MSPTMVAKGCKGGTGGHASIKFNLTNRFESYATTTGKSWLTWSPMTLCSGILEFLLCSSRKTFRNQPSGWTQVANKYCSHFDKTSKNCGPLRLQDNARKHIELLRSSPLTVYLPHGLQKLIFFIIPVCTCISSARKTFHNQIVLHHPLKLPHIQKICVFIWWVFCLMLTGPT